MKYSSIVTYYQAVVFYHKLFGFRVPLLSDFRLKYILAGIQREPGKSKCPMDPFSSNHLKKLYFAVNLDFDLDFFIWVACLILFRSLLRVSHVVVSPHALKRSDVSFKSWGLNC